FANTPLDQFLEEQKVGQLVIAGLDAENCVLAAIEAASNRGYPITVFQETVIAEDEARMPEILDTYKELGVEVLTMK
ncbi:MAG: isochorismatase family protein, partial [Bacteroidota bacterium]|nr:isochorismatase family protein [Bacteroidota bacterium]